MTEASQQITKANYGLIFINRNLYDFQIQHDMKNPSQSSETANKLASNGLLCILTPVQPMVRVNYGVADNMWSLFINCEHAA